MSSRRLSIRLSKELEKRLAALVRRSGRTESEVVRDAIADYCARDTEEPSAYDVLKKSGLIGCARGLPADLSTNPKYMEGFGRD